MQRILHSRLFTLAVPLRRQAAALDRGSPGGLPPGATDWRTSAGTGASIFLAVNLLLNSRLGRNVEEVVADWIVQGWHRFGLRMITGLFWFFVDVFRRLVETVERLMYAVDEWLRFRSGEAPCFADRQRPRWGLLWFFVAYVLRFAVNVLIEPQINPIKHFPVVTVAPQAAVRGLCAVRRSAGRSAWNRQA